MNTARTVTLIVLAGIIVGTILLIVLNEEKMVVVSDESREVIVEEFVSSLQENVPVEDADSAEKPVESAEPAEKPAESGRYAAYSEMLVRDAVMTGRAVLFFHAPWCPTCRTLNTEAEAGMGRIPDNVSLLKVDYDSADALKRKHRVTYQHTFVEVDGNLDTVQSWSGLSFDNLVEELHFSNSSEHPYGNARQPL